MTISDSWVEDWHGLARQHDKLSKLPEVRETPIMAVEWSDFSAFQKVINRRFETCTAHHISQPLARGASQLLTDV